MNEIETLFIPSCFKSVLSHTINGPKMADQVQETILPWIQKGYEVISTTPLTTGISTTSYSYTEGVLVIMKKV